MECKVLLQKVKQIFVMDIIINTNLIFKKLSGNNMDILCMDKLSSQEDGDQNWCIETGTCSRHRIVNCLAKLEVVLLCQCQPTQADA